MRWAGHVQRMRKDRLSKRAWKAEEGGRRIRGRPKLRWKDCVKRDLERGRYERPRVEDHRRRQREKQSSDLDPTPQGEEEDIYNFNINNVLYR